MQQEVLDSLLTFIANNFMIEKDEIPLDDSLVDAGIIDSFGLIEISAFMERSFGLKVTEEDMTRENFGSINRIVDFILRSHA